MWALRRMKALNMDSDIILDFYIKEVRCHLELAVPVWHSGLTVKQSLDIERVQRAAVSILTGKTEFDYSHVCSSLNIKPLHIRRFELCKKDFITILQT